MALLLTVLFAAPREHRYPVLVVGKAQTFAPAGVDEMVEGTQRLALSAMSQPHLPVPQPNARRSRQLATC